MNGDSNINSQREEDLVAEFRSLLDDIPDLPPDHELLRWIHSTSGNLGLSESLYRKSVQWRRERRVEELRTWSPPEVIRKCYPGGPAGHDAENCPVWIIPFGTADVKGILRGAGKDDFIDFTIHIVETSLALMRDKSLEDGASPVTQHVFIFDLQGFSLAAATNADTLDILRKLISIYEKNYPETLKAAYVLNASSVFQLVFRLVQATVQARTLAKIGIFGSDPELWPAEVRTKLERYVDRVNRGGQVPRSLYLVNDSKKSVIGPGKCFILEFSEQFQFQLSWMFMSEGGDLALRVMRHSGGDKEGDEEVVVAMKRVPSNKEIVSGHLICQPSPFTYSIVFDNSYSVLRGKTVFYKCEALELAGDKGFKGLIR